MLQKSSLEDTLDSSGLEPIKVLQEGTAWERNIRVEVVRDPNTSMIWAKKTTPVTLDRDEPAHNFKVGDIRHLKLLGQSDPDTPVTREVIIADRIIGRARDLEINLLARGIAAPLFYEIDDSGETRKIITYSPFVDTGTLPHLKQQVWTLSKAIDNWLHITLNIITDIMLAAARRYDDLIDKFEVYPNDNHGDNILLTLQGEVFAIDFEKYFLIEELQETGGNLHAVILVLLQKIIIQLVGLEDVPIELSESRPIKAYNGVCDWLRTERPGNDVTAEEIILKWGEILKEMSTEN